MTALVVMAGCSRRQDPPATNRTAAEVPSAPQDFSTFWTEFRARVLGADRRSVAALTRFPFLTRGDLDDSPEKSHDRITFIGMLDKLLEEDAGLSAQPEAMKDFIRRTERIPPGAGTSDQARVGNFVFMRIDGRWLFTKAYVSE